VRNGGEKFVLAVVGLLRVLGFRVCQHGSDDQALVGLAQLGHEIVHLRLRLLRLLPRTHGVFTEP
jgi:hypothetical protein